MGGKENGVDQLFTQLLLLEEIQIVGHEVPCSCYKQEHHQPLVRGKHPLSAGFALQGKQNARKQCQQGQNNIA